LSFVCCSHLFFTLFGCLIVDMLTLRSFWGRGEGIPSTCSSKSFG
jgi:hypothetical protein